MYRRKGFRWTGIASTGLALASVALLFTVGLTATGAWAGAPAGEGSSASSGGRFSPADTPSVTATAVCSSQYAITTSTGTIEPGTQDLGNHCDNCTTPINVPFRYYLYNSWYLSPRVSSNGVLMFIYANTTSSNTCLPVTNFDSTIFGYYDDLRTDCAGCGIFTSVSGSTPDRIFNVEWRATQVAGGGSVNFEIRLYENQRKFDIVYGTMADSGENGTVGVEGSVSGGQYTQYSCNQAPLTPGTLVTFTLPACAITPTITGTPAIATSTTTPAPVTTCGPNSNYVVTSSTGTIDQGTTDIGNHCDDCNTNIALPFTYYLYGQSFNSANVSSNGNLQFTSDATTYGNSCLPSSASGLITFIAGHWDDLRTDYYVENGIFTSVSGTAPNRIFNIEWRASLYGSLGPVNFEIRLYEGQDRFDVVYGTINSGGTDATVGVQRDTGSAYTQYECNTGGLTSGLLLAFTQLECGSPTPTVTGTPPTATSTPIFTYTRTSTYTRTLTYTRTPTITRSPTYTRTPTITPVPVATCGPDSNYTITSSTGAIDPGTTELDINCDDCNITIALPFTYRLYGQSFNSANISSNGSLQFVSNYNLGYGFCLPNTNFNFAILPFLADLRTDYYVENGIFTSVSGSAPNRIFNIEWRTSFYANNVPANFELRLYEGQDRFDVVYGVINSSGGVGTIGAQREVGSAYTQYQCNFQGITSGLLLSFTQSACGSPTPTFTGTPPTATSTVTPTGTRTSTFTRTATGTRTGTVTNTATSTPNTNTGFAHFAPAGTITVTQGTTFTLDLLINTGSQTAAAQQSYLTFTNSLLQVASATTGACGVLSATVSPDTSTFDAVLQNEVCNSNSPCDFGRIVAPPGSIAFASGALANPSATGDFRVAQVVFCANIQGTARLHWQFSPPAPSTRNTEILDASGALVSNPALYSDQVVRIVPSTNNALVGHVTWQGRPGQPNALQQLPITLTLKLGSTEVNYPVQTTDASGFFTVSLGTLANGTYNWRVKDPRYVANSGTVTLTGSPSTSAEMGLMRAGDTDNDNFVNASDFIVLRNTYGLTAGDPGYDARADFTGDQQVTIADFNLLKVNFGITGAPPLTP